MRHYCRCCFAIRTNITELFWIHTQEAEALRHVRELNFEYRKDWS